MTELSEDELGKAMWHFTSHLNAYLKPLRRYGQSEYVDIVIPQIEQLAWRWHWELEGVDEPYDLPTELKYTP